jgi:hypothetical protein
VPFTQGSEDFNGKEEEDGPEESATKGETAIGQTAATAKPSHCSTTEEQKKDEEQEVTPSVTALILVSPSIRLGRVIPSRLFDLFPAEPIMCRHFVERLAPHGST